MADRTQYSNSPSVEDGDQRARRPVMHYALWVVQVLLALLFLFAGVMKLVLPLDALKGPIEVPGLFLRFIGVCEVLGGIGLILPGLLRIRPGLTPLAAAGLVIIMIGATLISLMGGGIPLALPALLTGLLSAFVAWGRWRLTPLRGRSDIRNADVLSPHSTGA